MNIENTLTNFWQGKLTLWKSYWIVGEIINSFFIIVIFNIEIKFLNNTKISEEVFFFSFNNFNFINKLFITLWTMFITIGIWRSAENYKGRFIWTALTLIVLSYRIYTLRILFY